MSERHGWIDAGVCVPEPLADVLIVYDAGLNGPQVDMGYRNREGNWLLSELDDIPVEVTHWQRLPALPAELEDAA